MSTIQIATDGSCIQQGGFAKGDATDRPGASGFVAKMPDGTIVGKATPFANGTIGEMEIKGLRMGLEFAAAVADRTQERITIKCDSQFVVNGFNDWLNGWAAKGYHKKGGLTGAHDWRAIDALKQSLGDRVKVEWVKGHSGDPLNERVDGVVNGAARSQNAFDDTHLVLGAAEIARAPSALDPAAALARTDRENDRRLHEQTGRSMQDSVVIISESGPMTGRSLMRKNPKIFDIVDNGPSAVDRAGARGPQDSLAGAGKDAETRKGLHAQASALLSKAADDPRLARLLAQGLEMALDETRIVGRHDRDVVDHATLLQSVLQQRGGER
jgi:ribonuclease HI